MFGWHPELEFEIPVGKGEMGSTGDCWDRYKVRTDEIARGVLIADLVAILGSIDIVLGEVDR